MGDDQAQIRASGEPSLQPTLAPDFQPRVERANIALWTPSLGAVLLSGGISGAVLGAANGVAFSYFVGGVASALAACLWGASLGTVAGVLTVLVRRAVWGQDISVEVGTVLGPLYGIAPGLAALYQSIFINRIVGVWNLAGVVMVCSMMGLLAGGLLDRITGAVVARVKRLQGVEQAERHATAARPDD